MSKKVVPKGRYIIAWSVWIAAFVTRNRTENL